MEPTAASERIILLDVLRGVAIFGMFTVNMTADLPWGSAFREQPLDLADGIVMIFIDLFTNGKFITMFSFLFGVGVFLQLERARNRGIPFLAIYLRRLAALLLIAMVATVLGFGVSILIDYALFGLLLLLFYKQSARFLVVTAMICFVISVVSTNSEAVTSLIHTGQSEQVAFVDDDSNADASAEDERDRIYADGSFREIASFRAARTVAYLRTWLKPPWELSILGLMLLGGYVCRRGAIQNPAVRLKMARRVLPWLLGIGATSMVIFVWLSPWPTADTELLTLIGNLAFWPFGARFSDSATSLSSRW